MANGPSSVYMESRFVLSNFLVWIWDWNDTCSYLWVLFCALFAQEPVSVAFSALNLSMHFHGWLSFFILLYYKLPLRQDKKAHYEFASLWHIYALFAMNSWFWSAVFHSRWAFKFCLHQLLQITCLYLYSTPWLLLHAIEVQWCGSDREIGLLICCGITWVFTHSGNSKKFQCEAWGYQSHGCSSFACFCTYAYLIHQLLRAWLW